VEYSYLAIEEHMPDYTFVLGPHQGVTIPRGVMHRPRAPKRTVIVMVGPATVQPTGD
jgi:mannose-6-phosphate isomerase-like protein (cupin superfamily)